MNRELKGFMAKFDIHYSNLANVLGLAETTIGKKVRNESFDQKEIKQLIDYFKQYDRNADFSIFFEKEVTQQVTERGERFVHPLTEQRRKNRK